MYTDQLTLDARLDCGLHSLEGLSGDTDRPELGKVHVSVAADYKLKIPVLVPVELHCELIARADHIVSGHRHVRSRSKRRDLTVEQIVAEGFQRRRPGLVQRQLGNAHVEPAQ